MTIQVLFPNVRRALVIVMREMLTMAITRIASCQSQLDAFKQPHAFELTFGADVTHVESACSKKSANTLYVL